MKTENDVTRLMTEAQQQLDEHKAWLKIEISMHATHVAQLQNHVDEIKLRMARVDAEDSVSILWEYPEELLAYLRDPSTPDHLRKTLEGGCVVDLEQPGFSAKRAN